MGFSFNGSNRELEKFPDAPLDMPIAPSPPPDAGMRSLDHYKRRLPKWRYRLRQRLLPLVRWETPYLAWMQDKMRSPALDSYFAITANLGTHTFFMTALPVLFWCGNTSLGRGMVHILATGVFFTGFIKDLLSLPRPLSPPLQRITMSGSAALEYGFPSTHSANAVSVAVYALFSLHSPDCTLPPMTRLLLEIVAYCYALSITLGRLYCGMHGFVDVIIGSLLGAFLPIIECVYGPAIDNYLYHSSGNVLLVVALTILALVRIHPEPADDCPCFDDSVAFAGVMIGIEVGGWHYALTEWAWQDPAPGTVPFNFKEMGWVIVVLRVVVGVLGIFAWRGIMKPVLLKTLPHVFRSIDQFGVILPRKYFKPASEYKDIPSHLKVDNVMPSVSDLPSLLTTIRHPRRGRSVSIGPQSAADAYETLAYREKRRRDSISSNGGVSPPQKGILESPHGGSLPNGLTRNKSLSMSQVSGLAMPSYMKGVSTMSTAAKSRVDAYEQMMGQGQVPTWLVSSGEDDSAVMSGEGDELGEKEMFSRLEKPRVRYDVEVVTKLVVYSGIAWLAVEGMPIFFELIGLGMTGREGSYR